MNILNPGLRHSLIKKFKRQSYSKLKNNGKVKRFLNFADNENTYGPAPIVYKTMKKNIIDVSSYPDGESYQLKRVIANYYNLNLDQITITSGVMETFRFLLKIFNKNLNHVVFSENSFIQYKISALLENVPFTEVPFIQNYSDIDKIILSIKKNTRLVFLSNPDNPSGRGIQFDFLIKLLKKIPRSVIVVIDEAYIDYSTDIKIKSSVPLVNNFTNLVVLNSFSKIYGLPGLRIGFCLSANKIINKNLSLVMPPFNVSAIAQIAAQAAFKDQNHIKKIAKKNSAERKWLSAKLNALDLTVTESHTNFLLVDLNNRSANNLFSDLLKKGILVKNLTNYGFPNHHRVTVMRRSENKKLVAAYMDLL